MTPEYNDSQRIVLIVDDDPFGIIHLQSLLQDSGYAIITAPDGRSALEIIRKQPPDIILLDIIMPEMDGYETCRRLKKDKRFANIPVVFLSGLYVKDKELKVIEVGGAGYITKPFSEQDVLTAVQTHLMTHQLKR
ncbi:MAG: response regulator [Candidatus Electrothrix sp. AR4]|nr:response regulator [Candidatus Electrothrix sp. AR4]